MNLHAGLLFICLFIFCDKTQKYAKNVFRGVKFHSINGIYCNEIIDTAFVEKTTMLKAVTPGAEDIDLHASVRCSSGKTPFPDIQVDAV